MAQDPSSLLESEQAELSEETAWDYLNGRYPPVARHLLPFADKARKRGDKGEFWWELRACAYYDKFATDKIFYPDITDSPKFHLDRSGAFASNTAYFYPDGSAYLAGLLNSRAIWFFLTGIADSVRGGFYRMFAQNLNRIPVPKASDEEQQQIAALAEQCQQLAEQRYKISQRFIQRMIDDLCPQGREAKINTKVQSWWQLDFKRLQVELRKSFKLKRDEVLISLAERDEWQDYFDGRKKQVLELDDKLAAQEMLLNQAVNKLFGLTEDEIGLLG
jgi:hypothetical protein